MRIPLALALACVSLPALAAGDTAVVIPWGEWLVAVMEPLKELLVLILTGLATMLVARLGPMARMLVSEALIESTVRKWVDYGIAATAGAAKGRSVSFDVGSQVVAKTINRAQERAAISSVSQWALDAAGGPQELANKVIRMLPIDEGVRGDVMARSGLAKASDDRAMGNNS